MTVETTTLWDLLTEPSLTLQLPRFALFLVIAMILEFICSKKKICLLCSASTVSLLIITGIGGIIATTLMVATHIYVGTRVNIPVCYYPATAMLILGITIAFLMGVKFLLRERLFSNSIIRCLMFGITVYFAVTTIITPTKFNRCIEALEKDEQTPLTKRPRETDKAFRIYLDKEILLNRASLVEEIDIEVMRQLTEHFHDGTDLAEIVVKGILVEVNEANEHLLNWDIVAEILMVCAEEGFTDVEINNFRWRGHIDERGSIPPHYEETDTLIIQKNDIGHGQNENNSANMSPDDQYEWDLIHAWCKRNHGKHATVSFGGSVAFDALEEVVRIFDAQGVTFDLTKPNDSSDPEYRRNIKLELFTHRKQEQVPNQSSDPTSLDAQN